MPQVAKRNAVYAIRELRDKIDAARPTIAAIRSDGRLSDQGKQEKLTEQLASLRATVNAGLGRAREAVNNLRALGEQRLKNHTTPSDVDVQKQSLMLRPVIDNAISHPDGLLNAYQRTFGDYAARALIEGAIASAIDALPKAQAHTMADRYQNLQRSLEPMRSPEEKDALGVIAVSDSALDYFSKAEALINHDIATIEKGAPPLDMNVPFHEVEVAAFEREADASAATPAAAQ